MDKWIIDTDRSVATFEVRLLFRRLRGKFTRISGTALLDPDDITRSSVAAVIDAASAAADDAVWNTQLKGAHFLDAEHFPEISFRSSSIEPLGGSRVRIFGELTLHGTTCEEMLDAEYSGPVAERDWDYPGEERLSMGLSATTAINREDYGIAFEAKEAGSLLLGKEILITLDITLVSAFVPAGARIRT
ncbi:MAG: YceI family protein [Nitrospirota bacterium]